MMPRSVKLLGENEAIDRLHRDRGILILLRPH